MSNRTIRKRSQAQAFAQGYESSGSNNEKFADSSFQKAGKWSAQEELYAKELIIGFETGSLTDCEEGATLRSYLARRLNCAPMRISKKFAGKCIGKHVFVKKDSISESERAAAEVLAFSNRKSKMAKTDDCTSDESIGYSPITPADSPLSGNGSTDFTDIDDIDCSDFDFLKYGFSSNKTYFPRYDVCGTTAENHLASSVSSSSSSSSTDCSDPADWSSSDLEADEWRDVLAQISGEDLFAPTMSIVQQPIKSYY